MDYIFKVGETVAASDFGEWFEGILKKMPDKGIIFEVEIIGWSGPLVWFFKREHLLPIKVAREERKLKVAPPWEGEFISGVSKKSVEKTHKKNIMRTL